MITITGEQAELYDSLIEEEKEIMFSRITEHYIMMDINMLPKDFDIKDFIIRWEKGNIFNNFIIKDDSKLKGVYMTNLEVGKVEERLLK